ncbi:MAG: hypothetical protein GY715_06915 [Planctomycetes bacterium]|nr:hypothetical protein [Planctomycetota bacterium]
MVLRLIRRHNERVEHLRRLHSIGVLEFEWVGEDGKRHHEPQVNMTLWIDLPRGTALRAEKLGENLLWVGSNAERYWVFDLMSSEPRLFDGPHDAPIHGGASPFVIRPLALLDLLALSPVADPAGPGSPSPVRVDPKTGAMVVTTAGRGGPMRLHLDTVTGLPRRVETLSPAGEVALFSVLDRDRSVPVPGVSIAARPRQATRIRIADPAGTVGIGLFLDSPGPRDPSDRWDRVFDFDRLLRAFRPVIINGEPSD